MGGKSIMVYLCDGDVTGIVKCSLANWTGVAYKIPRTQLKQAENIECLNQSGVYFLFGESDEGEPKVYIGQAGSRKNGKGLMLRVSEHNAKEWWNTVVVFTTTNNWLGFTEISWLENQFYQMAKEVSRYRVENANDPSGGNLTEERKADLDEYIDHVKIVIGNLGYKVFDPLNKEKTAISDNAESECEQIYIISTKKAEASGKRTSEGFIVLKNSQIAQETTPTCSGSAIRAREKYSSKIDKATWTTLEDLLFGSPSGAASFVLGASSNGYDCWKNADGRTLGEIERKEDADIFEEMK